MKIKVAVTILFCFIGTLAISQDADQVVSGYIEKSGGLDAWKDIKSMKITASFEQSGMEMPAVIYRKPPAKNRTEIEVQGSTIIQAYDGETGWILNPLTGSSEAQKMPDEMSKAMSQEKFESELINYKEKGHKVEFEGTETVSGNETYRIKLIRNNGDTVNYFFDVDSSLPVMERRTINIGPMKGNVAETFIGDYSEVNGLLLPHTIEVKSGGQTVQKLVIREYALNEPIDDTMFQFPSGK